MPGFQGGGGGGGSGGGGGFGGFGTDYSPIFTGSLESSKDPWDKPKSIISILGLQLSAKQFKDLPEAQQDTLRRAAKASYINDWISKHQWAKGDRSRGTMNSLGLSNQPAEIVKFVQEGIVPSLPTAAQIGSVVQNILGSLGGTGGGGGGGAGGGQGGFGPATGQGTNAGDVLNQVIAQNQGGGLLGILSAINQGVFGAGSGGSSIFGGGTTGGGGLPTTGGGMANGIDWGTLLGLGAGGLLQGLGSLGGGLVAADQAKFDRSGQQLGGFDPRADPLLAALSAQSLAQIGVGPDRNIMQAASPVNRLENTLLNSLGGKTKGKQVALLNQAIQALHAGASEAEVLAAFQNKKGKVNQKALGVLQTALSSGGFGSLGDLLAQERAYQTQAAVLTGGLQQPALERFQARNAANQSINQILSDYPVVTQGGFDQAVSGALEPYHAQELEQANALGYNPSTNLALTRQAGIRDALSILSGRQGLANNALVGLQGSLSAQEESARGTSAQSLGALANSSNLASQQALALNQLAQQSNLAGAQALGSGIQGGLGSLGQSAQLFGLLNMLGAQPGTQPRQNPPLSGSDTGPWIDPSWNT